MRQPFRWDMRYAFTNTRNGKVCEILYDNEVVGFIYPSDNGFAISMNELHRSAMAHDLGVDSDYYEGENAFLKLVKIHMLRIENLTEIIIDRKSVDNVTRKFQDGVLQI